jgi:hypothetical protein
MKLVLWPAHSVPISCGWRGCDGNRNRSAQWTILYVRGVRPIYTNIRSFRLKKKKLLTVYTAVTLARGTPYLVRYGVLQYVYLVRPCVT